MYLQLKVFCLITLPVLLLRPFDSHAQVMTLKECIHVTLQEHPNSTINRNNQRLSEEKIREARSALLPTVSVSANTDYNLKLQTSVIPAGTFGTEETRLQMGNKFSSAASVQADLDVFDQYDRIGLKASKIDKEVADLTALKENETLIYDAASAYYQVLIYREKGKLLQENKKQYQQLLDIVALRYQQGVAKKTEYDRARVNLNNILAEITLNDNNDLLALNKLKNAMGWDLQKDLLIADSVENFSAPTALDLPSQFDTQNLLSYQIDQKNILLKELDVRQKTAAFLPTVSITAKYGATAYGGDLSSAYKQWFDYSLIGLKLSVPLYSGFKKSSQLNQSRINLENQRLTLKLNYNDYQLEHQNSGSQLLSSYNSLTSNKENLDLAKSVLEATTLEYREGTADLSTFMDAGASFKEAQTNYTTALLDFLTSQLAYERAKGTLTNYITNLK